MVYFELGVLRHSTLLAGPQRGDIPDLDRGHADVLAAPGFF